MTHPSFPRPLRASKHCRHYSYKREPRWQDSGPHCALGHDLIAPGASGACMPEPRAMCLDRAEYTDAERQAWRESVERSQKRLAAAICALPSPIPLNTSGTIECPNCAGRLHYSRWHRGAQIGCETDGCCGAHLSIAPGTDWPVFTEHAR